MAYKTAPKSKTTFSSIRLSLASPEEILAASHGEVTNPNTLDYKTYKPVRDGLFCERIFGPVKDYECNCGKFKRIRFRGTICDRCGVEVTEKKVRRERTGHIKLAVPVAHIWYFRSLPNKLASLLNLKSKDLEAIIYYEKYIVLQSGVSDLEVNTILTEEEYQAKLDELDQSHPDNYDLPESDPDKFVAKIGAEALYEMLSNLDLDSLSYELRDKAQTETSQQRRLDALKRLNVVESFRASKDINRPEWMILKVVPVIPPDLRPLVPLDGGRFATSDLNELYRRVILRNNRLKRLLEQSVPEVIIRNEKRMLQEAVDSLLDNSRKSSAFKGENNRPLKSLSDSLKGKPGRFRQNLLGKRVDYSARSVIVVGPELQMHECGLPKDMAAELYKPFIICKLIERGVVKTVKSAKRIVDRRDNVIWEILENVMKGHPVLLNRAPTLHRLGIQAFQPKMIEGKAIQLHPLACTAFNADFDGDQMAVHLPLGNEAILEAQLLMLASHNILNPANGAPITVPSQDMVLGLYYITKIRKGVKGSGLTFYGVEEAQIAYNEGKLDIHAPINVLIHNVVEGDQLVSKIIETSMGRIMVNENVPTEVGYINETLGKGALRSIISNVIKVCGFAKTAQFLDKIKNLGYRMAFKGGLSFRLQDVVIPKDKERLVAEGNERVEEIFAQYNEGFITNTERYNQIIDTWSNVSNKITASLMRQLAQDDEGFNNIFMMMDSGARGSKEQIRQLAGIRGLMAKPQKSGSGGGQVIENPILSNFKEGLSVLEYFISSHGARKGLADTALKTADAGYLTRRLVDVSHDVVISEEDCGTLRGIEMADVMKNSTVVATLGERILGRTSVHDIKHPETGEYIVRAGEEINEAAVAAINAAGIETVEVRSVLTCETKNGVCAKCYGRNLATNKLVQRGEVVGVIAAQAIGEPGTQLTLRTFHAGGTASNQETDATVRARFSGTIEYSDIRYVDVERAGRDGNMRPAHIVVNRTAELRILDPKTGVILQHELVPYASTIFFANGATVSKDDTLLNFDPHNTALVSEFSGRLVFENLVEKVTFEYETDESASHKEMVIIRKQGVKNNLIPTAQILDEQGNVLRSYNLPVGAHLVKDDGDMITQGDIITKTPRAISGAGDITGGLPRVQELFEARNPSSPAVVAEIDGTIDFGGIKRGNQEISITSRLGEIRKYFVPLTKQILVQPGDYVRAGMPLSEGAITPADILAIKGPTAVQEYIVNEVQDVYRLQGVKINDKHFEVIVRQMMRKVQVIDPGDTLLMPQQIVDKNDATEENDKLWGMKVITDAGDSTTMKPGQIISSRKLRDENSSLKRRDLKPAIARDAMPATTNQILQGITKAALQTRGFISAASFQETSKVLNDAAISGKVDKLEGIKENVICGHLIPAGTGLPEYDKLLVMSQKEHDEIEAQSRQTGSDASYRAKKLDEEKVSETAPAK